MSTIYGININPNMNTAVLRDRVMAAARKRLNYDSDAPVDNMLLAEFRRLFDLVQNSQQGETLQALANAASEQDQFKPATIAKASDKSSVHQAA